jgi:hypothetical protein
MSGTARIVAETFPQDGSVDEVDAYRANLDVCWRMARDAPNHHDKRAWLDMAESCPTGKLLVKPWLVRVSFHLQDDCR